MSIVRPPYPIAGGSADGTREMTMTKQPDFKRRVRARMAKTGESYATARRQILGERPDAAVSGPAAEPMATASAPAPALRLQDRRRVSQ